MSYGTRCIHTTQRNTFFFFQNIFFVILYRGIKSSFYFRTKEAFVVKLLQTIVPGNEEDESLSGDLFKKCFDEKVLTKENISKVCWTGFKKL